MSDDILKVVVDAGVATLTMNRPQKRNAISDRLLARIEVVPLFRTGLRLS